MIIGLGILVYFSYFRIPETRYLTKTTTRGQKATITLSDGSKVWLNAESTVTFAEQFDGETREISLEGEAFFDVVRNPNQPFIVKTDDLTTRVLGTSFNVSAYPGEKNIQVTVATGKVEVSPVPPQDNGAYSPLEEPVPTRQKGQGGVLGPATKILLTPTQQAIFNRSTGSLEMQKVASTSYHAWKDQVLSFDSATLEEVAQTLERWFDVKIDFREHSSGDCQVTVAYERPTLQEVLADLNLLTGIDYKILPDSRVEISGKGCM